jgi:acetyltransferase-like isoleucine patch superfamily enzyme
MVRKLGAGILSIVDPRSYLHAFRLLHYYGYSHVRPRRKLTLGEGVRMAPNVSIVNAERIAIGARSRIGAHCYLWAGDSAGRITIGAGCLFAPEVFVTASNYGVELGVHYRDQPRDEQDVVIGNDVWLGARVFVGPGVTIGDGCVVAAGAVVAGSLPPNTIAAGVPARVVRTRT